MRRRLRSFATTLLLAYAGLCGCLYVAQRSLLYHPTPEVTASGEALWVPSGEARLKVWRVGDGRTAVLYFGGNAENVARNIPRFSQAFTDRALYFVNYRGYGGSSGTPSEEGLYRDAAAVYDYLRPCHERIAVIGRSLGSGVAVWLAAERPVARLALVTPYDSIANVARGVYPFVPISLLLADEFPAVERADEIDVPVLILAAERDRVIPRKHALALARAFRPEQLEFRTLTGTTHNSIGRSPAYVDTLEKFLRAGPAPVSDAARPARDGCPAAA